MFFQTTGSQAPVTEQDLITIRKYSDVLKEIQNTMAQLKPTEPGKLSGVILDEITSLAEAGEALNANFVASRLRLQEMMRTLAEASPGITKLGGNMQSVANTIGAIADASKRNVVAQSKDLEQLYASSVILGQSVKTIVNDFTDVGYSYDKISENLEKSIVYVQSVGLNAKTVMADVLGSTEKISRFNFNEGVLGLTKMAAQASRLRFDMKETFQFAEKVLDPEEAVKMAAAFQRLGVSVGNLTDPFQLMNQSINDPSGLQDSLINVAKSFAYFDEKTKSFKINPQGILTLNAMAAETGVSAENMRKTALAAAEMDDKLKRINTAGLSLNVSEEDRKMIANVSRMGKGGEYEVSIKDEAGNEYQRKLVELQEQDFQRLIQQQKEAPKTLQEIQDRQLNTADKIYAELRSIKEFLKTSLYTTPGFTRNMEQTLNIGRDASKAFSRSYEGFDVKVNEIREKLNEAEKIKNKTQREKAENEQYKKLLEFIQDSYPTVMENISTKMAKSSAGAGETARGILNSLGFGGLYEDSGRRLITPPEKRPKRINQPESTERGPINYDILGPQSQPLNATALNRIPTSGLALSKTENVNVKFDQAAPIMVVHQVKADNLYDYTAFNKFIKDAPDGTKEIFRSMMKDIALRTGEAAKKGNYTFTV